MISDREQNAFQVLIESVQNAQEAVNLQGKEAFEKGNYGLVEQLTERGLRLKHLSDQIREIQNQWAEIMTPETEKPKPESFIVKSFRSKSLESFYHEYSKNPEEIKDYQWRKEKYVKIPNVLDQVIEAKNKTDFFELYEQLVGKLGQRALWHSGFLFRQKSNVTKQYPIFQEMVQALRDHPHYSPSELFALGKTYTQQVKGLAVNVMTEVMHSYYMDHCITLNGNSLTSMKYLFTLPLPSTSNSFSADQYQQICDVAKSLCDQLKMENLGQVDHFLNYVYWRYSKKD